MVSISSYQTSPNTTFEAEATYLSHSVSGNYSVVRCYIEATNGPGGTTGSWYGGAGEQRLSIVGGDVVVSRKATSNFLPAGYSDGQRRWRMGPYDVRIDHEPDGSHAPLTFGMVLDYSDVNTTAYSSALSLPTIPRASKATFSPSTQIDAGTTVTIDTNRASTSFTHDITYTFGSLTETIATGVGASVSWTPPLSLLTQMPDDLDMRGYITVVTKSGGDVIGDSITYFRIFAPDSVVPTISAINVSDDNPDVASLIGGFVQGQSLLKATVVAEGAYGSTISSAMVTLDGATVASGQTLPMPQSGTRVVAGAVTDSRGRTASGTGNVTVLAYDLPQIINYIAQRATSTGTPSDTGTYLQVTLDAAVSSLVVGSEKNAMTVTIATRPRGGSVWTDRNVITPGLAYASTVLVDGGGIFAANQAWDVRVTVSDVLTTAQDYYLAPTAGAILDVTQDKIALGKMVEDSGPALQFQGPARVYGAGVDVDGPITQGGEAVIDASDQATLTKIGVARIASQDDVNAGLDDTLIVTPATLAGNDTGWIDLSSYLLAGFTGLVEGRRVGKWIEISGNVAGPVPSASSATDFMGALPVEWRPSNSTLHWGSVYASGFAGTAAIRPAGTMLLGNRTGTAWSSGIQFTVAYLGS